MINSRDGCILGLILLACMAFGAGCNSDRFPSAPVSGRVKLNGKPLAEASVCFFPTAKSDDGAAGGSSVGVTDAEGRYVLQLVDGRKGAVIGTHRVTISVFPKDEQGNAILEEMLPRRFNGNTQLSFEVPEKGTEAADFLLQANDLTRPLRGPSITLDKFYQDAPSPNE